MDNILFFNFPNKTMTELLIKHNLSIHYLEFEKVIQIVFVSQSPQSQFIIRLV